MKILCEFCEIEMVKREDIDGIWECYVCPRCDRIIWDIDIPLNKLRKIHIYDDCKEINFSDTGFDTTNISKIIKKPAEKHE